MEQTKSLPRLKTPANIPLEKIPEIRSKLRSDLMSSYYSQDQDDENNAPFSRFRADPQLISPTSDQPASPVTKSVYFEDIFASRGCYNSPQGQVARDAVVVGELKINVKIKVNEFKLAGDVMFRLAQIYQRPETSILVTVQQDCLLFYGNITNAAYLLKIHALPSFIAPITNLRNTTLIQSALQELLSIPPSNGVIIYTAVPEDNLGFGGTTAGALISRLDNGYQDENVGLFRSISRSMSRRMKSSSGSSAPLSLSPIHTSNSPYVRGDGVRSTFMDEKLETVDVERGQSFGKETFRNLVRRHLKGTMSKDKLRVKDEEQTKDMDTEELVQMSKKSTLAEEHKAGSV